MMVEELAKGGEIGGVHEGTKTATHSVYVDPLVILFAECLRSLLKKLFMFAHYLLELLPLLPEVLSL